MVRSTSAVLRLVFGTSAEARDVSTLNQVGRGLMGLNHGEENQGIG